MLSLWASHLPAQTIPNPSFEAGPAFATAPGYVFDNAEIPGWTVSASPRMGLNPAGGAYGFALATNVPNGARVAFIQSTGLTSTLSTTITGLKVGVTYRVQFRANRRSASDAPIATYRLNGETPVSFTASPARTGIQPYYTINAVFTATATTAPLEISNTIVSGDATLLVDDFKITAATPIQVTTASNDGPGSLRQALATAAAKAEFNAITFAPALNGATITLLSGIDVDDSGGVTVDASALTAGITIDGGSGANRIFSVASGTIMSLRGLTFTGGNGGGAVADSYAGAILNEGMLTLTGCTLTGNATGSTDPDDGGGAIANSGRLALIQCTISGNSSPDGEGGAIYNDAEGVVTLTHCTISANTAEFGGGITNYGELNLNNTILSGNTATADADGNDVDNEGGTVVRTGANLVQALDNNSGGGDSGPVAIDTDPKLDVLAANGGPTKTIALLFDSPARNSAVGSTVTSDQRGKGIIGTADIGAYEMQKGTFTIKAQGSSLPGIAIAEGTDPVTVEVVRANGVEGTATVRVDTVAGTATPGEDYTGLSQLVTFDDGDTVKTVAIGMLDAGGDEPNETFGVSVNTPSSGSAIGTPNIIYYTIIDPSSSDPGEDDEDPSALTVASPAAGAIVNLDSGATLSVTGSAKDDHGLASVMVRTTTAGATPASLTAAATARPGATQLDWSIPITPVAGLNTIEVVATDYAGNTKTVTRSFRVRRPLNVQIVGNGSVTTGFAPSSYRDVGGVCTLTATPGKNPAGVNLIFAGWTLSGATAQQIGVTSAALLKPTLSFIFRENLVLRANFAANPYGAPVIGVYNGRVTASTTLPNRAPLDTVGAEDGTTLDVTTEGYFSAMVLSTGAFTAKLCLDGLVLPVNGVFDYNGVARFGATGVTTLSVARFDKPSLAVSLTIDVTAPLSGQITGTVTQVEGSAVSAVSDIVADIAPFTNSNPVPSAVLASGGANGIYNAYIKSRALGFQPAGYTVNDYPNGRGYSSITVTKTGTISISGVLADGSLITASTTLSGDGAWRLYVPLYNKLGVIAGNAGFDIGPSPAEVTIPNMHWARPLQDTQYYPSGWQEGIKADLFGAKYTVPALASVLPGLPTADADGNADLTFADGVLSADLTKTVAISTKDKVTNAPVDASFTLSITRSSGIFSGTFTDADGLKTFKGIIVQKDGEEGGYGYFLSTAPVVKDYAGYSDVVVLEAQP